MTKAIVKSFEASSFVPPSLQINGRGKHGKLIAEIADERSLRCAIAGICPSVRLGDVRYENLNTGFLPETLQTYAAIHTEFHTPRTEPDLMTLT